MTSSLVNTVTNSLLTPDGLLAEPVERLLVLVPDQDISEVELVSQVLALVSSRCLLIIYLSVTANSASEPLARRRLVMLDALTRTQRIHVQTRLEIGGNWLEAVCPIWKQGDILVCHAEQRLLWNGHYQALAPILTERLNAPVLQLTGLCFVQPHPAWVNLKRWALEIYPFAVIAICFVLQALISHFTTDYPWLGMLLMIDSVVVEFSLLWAYFRSFIKVRSHGRSDCELFSRLGLA